MKQFAPLALAALLFVTAPAPGQQVPASQPALSREEYEQLLQQQEAMRREIEQLKAQQTPPSPSNAPVTPTAPTTASSDNVVTPEDFDELDDRLQQLSRKVSGALPGTEHLLIVGDASIGFVNSGRTNSTFSTNVSPMILWQPADRLLFETSISFGLNTDAEPNSSTAVTLQMANASYIVNDYLMVGGGLFVVPFGQYHNHFDMPWINKLPDDPLAFGVNGIAPSSEVGIFGRGAAPIGGMKITYDAYATNGPQLITRNAANAGTLNFSDFTDLNNGKAVGGRLGFLPIPELETGYSFEYAQTAPSGFASTYSLLQAFDLNWVKEIGSLGGVVTARTEWVWSDTSRATFDSNGTLGFGPLSFSNYRTGGYGEFAYRPTLASNRFLRNTEFVFRYDLLRTPLRSPGGDHEQAFEFGVDYWLTPSAVLKLSYERDDRQIGPSENSVFVQLGISL